MCRRCGHLVEPELQAARDGGGAEHQPLVEQVAQAHHLGLALERDHVDVHAIVALEIRGREQVRHELRHVGRFLGSMTMRMRSS